MIKNAVFDLGNVMVSFNPRQYAADLDIPEETREDLVHAVVWSKEWSDYDRGLIRNKRELLEKETAAHPELMREIGRFLENWEELLTENRESSALVRKLKAEGYRVFLLSNLSYDGKNYAMCYPFMREFEGTVFSCDEHKNKPEAGLYRVLLDRYDLRAEETVFFDDSPPNVEGANALGIHGILFRNAEEAEKEFRRIAERSRGA